MKPILSLILCSLLFSIMTHATAAADHRCYEMRTYYVAPGKMEALHKRFRDHTNRLLEKHGVAMIGYWVPLEKKEEKLIFILSYPSREAREKSWQAFMNDPEWKAAFKASEAEGRIVEKVDTVFMTTTDYSPEVKPSKASEPRVFEMRTYIASPNNLDNLHARFRDHTVKLFSKHGMSHIGYWTPMKGEKGADNTLIYILAHKSREAAAESFKNFREDSDWLAARKASEEKAKGSLTAPNGVQSLFMTATDYSPTQ
jgi:hypothetical protein